MHRVLQFVLSYILFFVMPAQRFQNGVRRFVYERYSVSLLFPFSIEVVSYTFKLIVFQLPYAAYYRPNK
jgi:putative effector of murein hydrolase